MCQSVWIIKWKHIKHEQIQCGYICIYTGYMAIQLLIIQILEKNSRGKLILKRPGLSCGLLNFFQEFELSCINLY